MIPSSQGQFQLVDQNQVNTSNTSNGKLCEVCRSAVETLNSISCKNCSTQFHKKCVNLSQQEHAWKCSKCNSAPDSPKSVRSNRSCGSNSSTYRRRLLELQQLEEETQLQREFIKKKYQILHQAEEDGDQDISSVPSVLNWLNNSENNTLTENNPSQEQHSTNESVNSGQISQEHTGRQNTASKFTTNLNYEFASEDQNRYINTLPINAIYRNQNPFYNATSSSFPLQPTSMSGINHENNSFPYLPASETTTTNLASLSQPNVTSNIVYTTAGRTTTSTADPNYMQSQTHNPFFIQNKTPQTTFHSTMNTAIVNDQVNQISRAQPYTFHDHNNSTRPSSELDPSASDTRNNLTQHQLNVRQTVPKDLPSFSGVPEEWPLFNSTFEWSTMACGLTEAENLIRLQKALTGDALKSVQQILIHPSCVSTAMSTLKMLYGQPEKIVNSLKNKIRNLSPVNVNKLNTITSYAVEVKGLQTIIEACGLYDELNNSSLLQELVSKLPNYLQLSWGKHKINIMKNNRKANIREFAEWVYEIGISASSINLESGKSEQPPEHSRVRNKYAYVNAQAEQNKRSCVVCDKECKGAVNCKLFLAADRNKRWDIVRKCKLCKLCLLQHYGDCKKNLVCDVDGCSLRHNSLLHRFSNNELYSQNESHIAENVDQNKERHNVNTHSGSNQVLFKIMPINISNKHKSINTFAFIDDGSSVSLIEDNILHELNVNGSPEPLCLKWTNNIERSEEGSQRISVHVSGTTGKKYSVEFRTVQKLCLPRQSLNYEYLCAKFSHLRGLPISSYKDATPTMLIGLNNLHLCTPTRIREGAVGEPVAIRTRIGWVLCGNNNCDGFQIHHTNHICECNKETDDKLTELVKQFYKLEVEGVVNNTILLSRDDQRAKYLLEKNTSQLPNGHYETSLLWRFDEVRMPESYTMAFKRLTCLERQLKNNQNLFRGFEETIAEYLRKNYITKIDVPFENRSGNKVWYLPTFPVFNKNKPDKFRIVWDAAAKAHGVSLNSLLIKGPDLLTSLTGLMYRFRQRSVAVCGDLEQMFHQVFIRKEDRDAQRFLWRSCDDKRLPDIYVMNVLIFGASCAPSISQYIKNLNASHYEDKFPIAAASIANDHYVDDFLISTDTAEEAVQLCLDVHFIHHKGGFNIRNWCSNSSYVQEKLQGSKSAEIKCLNGSDDVEVEKVLGVFWCPSDDNFTFKISSSISTNDVISNNKYPTKRQVLRILMSVYDPLGLIGHFLMYLKIVLQDIWRSGVSWDEPILKSEADKWSRWLTLLPSITKIKIPRCYLGKLNDYNNTEIELHTFVDASENGYAAVSYLRISNFLNIVVSLIGSKTRVAPLKVASIPRLELMAAVTGARFAGFIIDEHNISIKKKVFWSDSRTVLSWIKSDHRKYHQFVAVRVSDILDTTEPNEWRWITGKKNVADDATKWTKQPDLSDTSRWFCGPEFLKLPESEWPESATDFDTTDVELKQHCLVIQGHESIINVQRFSRWCRLLRSVAFVNKFLNIISRRARSNIAELSQQEILSAENILFKEAQKELYLEEIECLRREKPLPKSSSIYKLSPYIDNQGVLRVGGRIENANVPTDAKFPIILPKHGYITKLVMMHYHELYRHCNNETVINEIRQKFYIQRLRIVYRCVCKDCQWCKVKKTMPQVPQMARLPRARLASYVAPFTYTGVDFFGPMLISVNKHKEKRYGALFTCLTIRAVHIEIVNSLSAASCIMAIRNFTARRGTPREFFSDNGTNFVAADRELRDALKDVDTNSFVRDFTTATTKWNFNPPAAPHMGGAWERLVRSVKSVLYKIFPERHPNEETLRSMMAEVENIVNSRPLTYVPIDEQNAEALTPNHFLLGSSNGLKPIAMYDDSGVVLRESWLRCQQYADQFWRRWVTEYLPTLTCRTKWFETTKPLEIGDLVVVVDPCSARNVWPRGRIVEVSVGSDGQVRKAKVMTKSGVLERPIAKLAVLDVAKQQEYGDK